MPDVVLGALSYSSRLCKRCGSAMQASTAAAKHRWHCGDCGRRAR